MNDRSFNRFAWAGAAMLVVCAIIAGLLWVAGNSVGGPKAPADGTILIASCSTTDKVDAVKAIMVAQGFNTNEFVVGEKNFVLTSESTKVGKGAFTSTPSTTKKAHIAFLSSNTAQANATVKYHMTTAHATKAEVLDPSNWYGVQIKVEADLTGNTVYQNGSMVAAGTRHSAVGDIVWVFVPPKACANGVIVIKYVTYQRAGCENPQHNPPTPHNPKPTPKPTPTCTKGPPPGPEKWFIYHPSNCTWTKKPQSKDCMLNGGPNCPPNGGHQPPQDNPGQPTGPSGPSQEPSPLPTAPAGTTPSPNPSGYNGGSQAPGPAPSNSPTPGSSAKETVMPPTPL